MRLRRTHCLVCYWLGDEFVAHPYLHGSPVSLPSMTAEVLDAFGEWRTAEDAARLLPAYTPETVAQAVDVLAKNGLLLPEGSPDAAQDEHVARQWESWSPEAPFFHYGTRHDVFEQAGDQDRIDLVVDGRPPLFTSYPAADRVLLPRPHSHLDIALVEALYARRTHRRFATARVPLTSLATLLAKTFGPVDYIDGGGFGALYRRTSPQGGARQEIDAYVGARSVAGLAPGWFHYNAREHSLELLAEGCTDLGKLCGGQEWVDGAAFVVVLVARMERMMVKYRNPRAYRVCLLNAGHLGQTFALVATALGVGPFQTGAFDDMALTERLGLDGVTAVPLYVLGAGVPGGESDTVPAGLAAFR
ncbi:SagB/ThcOx family dehydrogenase [Lentzea sp. NPDC051213]|uniref:SagB/ThcOx family dehydrogenase n=1 Tax=Lentzea sp. NPDC051213 TaxID=3364126 RepID=UPI00379A235F